MAPCPEFLDGGVCTTEDCPYQHNIFICRLCRLWCVSAFSYEQHLRGKKHQQTLRTGGTRVELPPWCDVCHCNLKSLSTQADYDVHVRGRRHQAALAARDLRGDAAYSAEPDARCDVCNVAIFARDKARHDASYEHKKKERFAAYQAAFDEAERDKAGVSVEANADFPFLDTPFVPGKAVHARRTVEVAFSAPDAEVYLTGARMSSSLSSRGEAYFTVHAFDREIRLRSGRTEHVHVDFDSHGRVGRFEDRLELTFEDAGLRKRFAIVRPIAAVVGNRADYEAIKPVAPYVPRERKAAVPEHELDIEKGPKPRALADVQWVTKLPPYDIPRHLSDVIATVRKGSELIRRLKSSFLPPHFSPTTYGRFFRTLLYVEEAQLSVDIETFDMDDVPLEPLSGFYRLAVPGLAEKRPSLIVGDRILVQHAGGRSGYWWEGRVFHVRQLEVDLKFSTRFNAFRGQKFNVKFRLNRLTLRRMHEALDSNFSQDRVLFPTTTHFAHARRPTQSQLAAVRPGERKIADNPHQLEAVAAILHQNEGSAPFIVFGPPGTGKTITIVEAMRQLTLTDPDACILACAPSNSAADLLAERLARAGLNARELFRLNAPSRSVDTMPQTLLPYSRRNDEGTFCVPPVHELKGFRVVVVTCVSASVPHGVGVPRGYYTHIFIDEAGQASEPEAMISIKTLADSRTNIILAGDPRQLGPIVHSRAAQALGLQLSFLDRLMVREAYRDDMRGISFVKLTQNFRSHPVILNFPNKQFYANELEPCGDRAVTSSLTRCDVLARQFVPIVFENIAGKDSREAQSPSFFNVAEASLVKQYVQDLLGDQKLRLLDEHIGIIAPYHAQVCKIRTLLSKLPKGKKIKVGSVEEFQGQERRVVIISTVRSSRDFVSYDLRHTLGFVANPRRFNVAITRAQALLVIVGDASVLSLDPLWRAFMNYVYDAGGWKGRKPDWDTEEEVIEIRPGYDRAIRELAISDMDALVERTKEVVLDRTRADDDAEQEWDGAVDKEWKEAE
ncbi:P-loop containing nucleoside triphosphate hydrolase protein [Auricularia subglabra TFB-10046 SS5]|nr:P-loop containing nucleoside triphosphate hydrolase protein [Auricularia subglabra TFB-10046 SS5]